MSVEKALGFYTGKSCETRFNCCQAVLKAFQDRYKISEDDVAKAEKYGRGKAPDGFCGALFSLKLILEKLPGDKYLQFESEFIRKAGSFKCIEIRKANKLSCAGCVALAAELLDKQE